MDLSPTGRVILGVLAVEPRSGYDIKALTDKSTRFFWAASYGQIYPELKRLAEAGLIEGSDEPSGGRKRTVYRITRDGRKALAEWLNAPEQVHELRDEGLLKLFFAATQGRDEVIAAIQGKRDAHADKARRAPRDRAARQGRRVASGRPRSWATGSPSTSSRSAGATTRWNRSKKEN